MKFNIVIDIRWIDEESGDLDQAIQDKLIDGLSRKIETQFMAEGGKKVSEAANKLITAKTELLIHTILERPVEISDGWNSKKEYESIYDMVEQRMSALYKGKFGGSGKCEKDPLLANIEKYVESHVNSKVRNVETLIERYAKQHAAKTLKESSLATTLRAIMPDANLDETIDK